MQPPGPPPQQPFVPNQVPNQPRPAAAANPAQTVAIVMIVCAVLILVGTISKSWLVGGDAEESGKIGLTGIEECEGSQCRPVPWEMLERAIGSEVPTMATLGVVFGIAAAAMSGLCGLLALMRSTKSAPVGLTRLALGLAAGMQTAFVVRILAEMKSASGIGPGWALFVSFGGIIASAIVLASLNTHVKAAKAAVAGAAAPAAAASANPYQQQPMQQYQPPPAHPTYPCRTCQRPLVFVAQYQRWFCESCRQYA